MPRTLTVDVNRDDLYALEVPDSFSTEGRFVIELRNHGAPVHVHLNVDDALARVLDLEAANHYLTAEETQRVDVTVRTGSGTVDGKLKVATAHGAETRFVDLEVGQEPEPSVAVDPELSKPRARTDDDSLAAAFEDAGDTFQTGGTLAVGALAVLAVALALAVGFLVGGVGAAVGALVVLLAVGAAVALVYS